MNIAEIIEEVRVGLIDLARNTAGEFVDQATQDGAALLENSKENLARWTEALAEGKLTPSEFAYLVKMQIDLAELHALTGVGLAQTKIERFRKGLISLVVNAVLRT